jgi:beta-lactamase regulating signal transducer with metallopeptidase domain
MSQLSSLLVAAAAAPGAVLLAKATLLLLLALGLTLVMQRTSAMARHLVWQMALCALLVLPAVVLWSPVQLAVLPSQWGEVAGTPNDAALATNRLASDDVSEPLDARTPTRTTAARTDAGAQTAVDASMSASAALADVAASLSFVQVMLIIWGAVTLAITAWLLYGAWTVRRIVRGATPLTETPWQSALFEISDRLSIANAPRLLRSDAVTMPFACGFRTPTIVLPADSAHWSADRRSAVLLHELGHIKRRDLIGHTLGRIACAVYWFHPLVWTAARKLRAESERACDDLALGCGTRASDYAEHLLEIVTSVRNHGTPSVAVAMATRSEFEGRMLAILDPTLPRTAPSRARAGLLAASVMTCAMFIGCMVPRTRLPEPDRLTQREAAERLAALRSTDEGTVRSASLLRADSMPGLSALAPRPATETRSWTAEPADPVEPAEPVDPVEPAEPPEPHDPDTRGSRGGDGAHQRMLAHALSDSSGRASALARVLRTDSSAKLRRVAAWGLHELLEDDAAVDALMYAARRDPVASVREMAVWSLGSCDANDRVTGALIDVIRTDSDRLVRSSAVWALTESGAESAAAIRALASALSDSEASVRELAAWGIGEAEPNRAPAQLIAALGDADAGVRKTVAWALHQIEDESSVRALVTAVNRETDPAAKRAMVRALGAMGEDSVDAMQGLIDSKDAELRSIAIHALAGRSSSGPWPQPRPRPRPFP